MCSWEALLCLNRTWNGTGDSRPCKAFSTGGQTDSWNYSRSNAKWLRNITQLLQVLKQPDAEGSIFIADKTNCRQVPQVYLSCCIMKMILKLLRVSIGLSGNINIVSQDFPPTSPPPKNWKICNSQKWLCRKRERANSGEAVVLPRHSLTRCVFASSYSQ